MRAYLLNSVRRVATAAVLITVSGGTAAAQLPNASTAAFGMGGNFTAIARGYEAVAWNPANLAMPGRPGFSLGIGVLGGSVGLDPIDFKTMHAFSGQVVDSATRVEWLNTVRLAGGQQARIDGGVTPLAFSIGPIGIQTGATAYTNLNLSPDAYEALLLFGNAGNNNGNAKDLDFTGTSIRAGVMSAVAASFAMPVPINFTAGLLPNERAAIGVTGKYVMGNGLIIAQDNGSVLGGSEMTIDFPMIVPDSNFSGALGTGIGFDIAASWSGGPWRVGFLAENVVNSFKWDTGKLAAVSGTGSFTVDSNTTNFDEQLPYSTAPQFLRDIVDAQGYKPALTLGAAFNVMPSLTLTADMKTSTGGDDAITIGPKSRMGVGAEWRIIPFLPIRAGVASVTDGWQAGAGIGLRLLGYELGVSSSVRRRGQANESGIMIGVVGIGR